MVKNLALARFFYYLCTINFVTMQRSMTGFGKAEVKVGEKCFVAEIRSLNSKQLDLSVKLPMAFRAAEAEVRSVVSKALVRGKVDVLITMQSETVQTSGEVNKDKHVDLVFDYPLTKIDSANILLTHTLEDGTVLDMGIGTTFGAVIFEGEGTVYAS